MRRAVFIIVALGIAAGLAAVFLSATRDASRRAFVLPDGSRVEFLGTSVGQSSFTTEKPWHQFARKILPRSWVNWIPPAITSGCSSGTNSVTVYVSIKNSVGKFVGTSPWDRYTTEDESGFVYQREGGSCSSGGGTGMTVHGLILRSFPRRQSSFKLHFYDSTNGLMGTLTVPNPVKGPFPKWSPQPLPQAQTNGPVTLTLSGLRESGSDDWKWVRPTWSLQAVEPFWVKSRVRSYVFADSSGNESRWLSPRETAWELRAWVYRERFEDFSADEKLVLTNLALPAAGEFLALDTTAELSGVTVVAHLIAGPGKLFITNGVTRTMIAGATRNGGHSSSSDGKTYVESWENRKSMVLIETRGMESNDELFLRLLNENGEEIKMDSGGGWSGNQKGGRIYSRTFESKENAGPVKMEVVVSRPLDFAFRVNPADVQAAKGK